MYFSVIPFSHSIWTTPLTYVWGDIFSSKCHPGSIVEIPYGKNIELWLIVGQFESAPETHLEIRNLEKIVTERAVIAPYQIEVIVSIAKKYMLPIHRVLSFFITRPILQRLIKYNFPLENNSRVDTIAKGRQSSLTFFSDNIVTDEILREYMRPWTLVICPDDFSLESYRKSFESENTLFVPGDATDTKKAKAWIDIRNGKYEQIFWTRRLLYYNLREYDHIIYLEDAFGREYFHFPSRIHYLDVLLAIEKYGEFDIDILTSTPLLSTLAHTQHFTIKNRL